MANIGTTLELYDRISQPLQNIANNLYRTNSAFEEMQETANSQFDSINYDNVRNQLDDVTKSIIKMREDVARDIPLPDIPTPDPIPISWDVQEIDVFKTSGVERFQSEISSATGYLDRLNETQMQIGRTAAGLDIIPDDAYMDIKNLTTRIGDIRTEIESLERNPMNLNVDQVNNQLETLRQSLSTAETQQSSLNDAMNRMDAGDIHSAYNDLNKTISQSERYVRDNVNAQADFTNEINNSNIANDGLISKIKKVAVTLGSVVAVGATLKKGFDRLISIDTATAKLQALGHSGQVVDVIMNDALSSVRGTAFGLEEAVNTAASAVAAGVKPGQQLERYLSLTADAAAIAGTNMNEMGAIFNKVSTSGIIQAQELNQISDRGIPIFQMLAEQMNVSAQEVRALASEGKISSEIFLNAVEEGFGGAAAVMGATSFKAVIDNIGASIARISANFINGAGDGQGFFDQVKPLMVNLLETLQSFEQKAMIVGQVFGKVFQGTYNLVSGLVGAIATYWSILAPLFIGIVTAMSLYYGYLLVTFALEKASAVIKLISAVASFAHAAATGAQASATAQATAAQWGLNTALLGSPITWIILAIIALIVVIFTVVAAINHFAGTSISAVGIIAGAVAWLGMLIWNIFIFVLNFVISVAEWIVNAWNLGIWLIQMAFIGLITLVLLIFDAILNVGIITAEFLVNAWNVGIWSLQMLWIGLNIVILLILDGILNFGIVTAELFVNAWNKASFGLQSGFYHMQTFASKVMQTIGNGAIGVVNVILGAISSIINGATGGINKLIGMANKLPFVNITSVGTVDLKVGDGVQNFVDNIGSQLTAPTAVEEVSFGRSNLASQYMNSVDVPASPETASFDRTSLASDFLGSVSIPELPELTEFNKLEYGNMSDAFNSGYEWGENLADKITNFDLMDALDIEMPDMEGFSEEDYLSALEEMGSDGLDDPDKLGSGGSGAGSAGSGSDPLGKDISDIADNTGGIKDALDMSAEDLKYLRDLAAREMVNRFTTAKVDLRIDGITNNVNNEMDLDGVVDYIVGGLEQAISITADGVHV